MIDFQNYKSRVFQLNTKIYVCGNAKTIAVGVYDELKKIAVREGRMSDEEAGAYVETLVKEGNLLQGVWAPSNL